MFKTKKSKIFLVSIIIITLIFFSIIFFLLKLFNIIPSEVYTAEDFDIETVYSSIDFNNNGIDDYTDILLGARADAENHPKYNSAYYEGGYPPDDIGVCTDVVWRAFKNAGYCLRDMVDNDIANRPESYPAVENRDNNIDFRRVRNLRIYFDKYAISLTTDINKIEEWQPGDIVIFGDNKHIGIVSNKRNKDGQVYIIHNAGQPIREEDCLKYWTPTAHYRFDASKITDNSLIAWHE